MRFIDILGDLKRSRRYVSGASNVQDEEVKNPVKLAEILRGILRRLTDVEASLPPEPLEFEVEVLSIGGLCTLAHNLNGPVRYWVTYWTADRTGAAPTAAPVLVADSTSDDNTLVLKSYAAGRAVIRVEPSFKGLNLGVA